MNCLLFAKMDQVFSKENKTLKKYWKIGKKILEKSGNFVSPEKWEPCIFQSDVEKLEGLPVAPFMDREKVSKPSAQIGFIKFVLLPLFESLGTLFPVIQVLHFVKLFHIHSLNFNNENAEWKCLIPDYFVRMKIKSRHDS